MRSQILTAVLFACVLCPAATVAQKASNEPGGLAVSDAPAASPLLLTAEDAAKMLPTSVFFRGLSAPIQARNSGGIRFADKRVLLITLVDTSGYSSQVQEKYQAYLIIESAITIEGHRLAPGAYGCGFIAGNTFVVQDVGAHDLFTAPSTRDASLHRPTPLQVLAAPGGDGAYRLYAGRNYITFSLAGTE